MYWKSLKQQASHKVLYGEPRWLKFLNIIISKITNEGELTTLYLCYYHYVKNKRSLAIIIALIFALAVVGVLLYCTGVGTGISEVVDKRKYCKTDADCDCGVNILTGSCFYGNKKFVNTKQQCPDFCSGISGLLDIKCIDNQCRQVDVTP